MLRTILFVLALVAAGTAHAEKMYRVDLKVHEANTPEANPLILLEAGKDASMEISRPDGSARRYELRVDARQDEKGVTYGTVHLRVLDITKKKRERVLGNADVVFTRTGETVAWKPAKPPKGLAIDVTLYLQPM